MLRNAAVPARMKNVQASRIAVPKANPVIAIAEENLVIAVAAIRIKELYSPSGSIAEPWNSKNCVCRPIWEDEGPGYSC
jgi:hypothetical protein